MSSQHSPIRVSVVATSSAVPQVELAEGIAHLQSAGLTVEIQPSCAAQFFVFAGDDQQRSESFYAAAMSIDCETLWCACGGYGSGRLLPLLEKLSNEHGTPPVKVLVGFSDATAIMSFVRQRWGWETVHAPMVASKALGQLDAPTLLAIANGQPPPSPWGSWPLRWITQPTAQSIEAILVGGNLAVWNSLTGTPYAEPTKDRILFLEDVDEPPYRIDRLITQLRMSGRLHGIAAIVLGGFTDCEDRVSQVISLVDPTQRVPLRRSFSVDEALQFTFGALGIPVAAGLPVGHGNLSTPLLLGEKYQLNPEGIFRFIR